jgi:large subunit GTPase 1
MEAPNPEAALIAKCRVVGREELIDLLTSKRQELLGGGEVEGGESDADGSGGGSEGEEGAEACADAEGEADAPVMMRPLTVGLVGYPNVGKSSTINALMGATSIAHGVKRVGVGSTPGKTKHFQVGGRGSVCWTGAASI